MSKINFYGITKVTETAHDIYCSRFGNGNGRGYGYGYRDGDGDGDGFGFGFGGGLGNGDGFGNGYGETSEELIENYKCQR